MIKEIIMPKLGETMEEGYLVSWKKNEGEKVEKGEILFEVMSDKTNFEIESPYSGYLRKILFQPSDQPIPVTTVIAYITDTPDEPIQVKESKEEKIIQEKVEVKKEKEVKEERIKISPVARRIADQHHIDITKIKGTGPEGRIEKKDVIEYIEKMKEIEEKGEYEIIKWTPLRKIIAQRLSESKTTIPHYYFQGKIFMDEILKIKEKLEQKEIHFTITDFLIFFVSRAIEKFPLIAGEVVNDEMRVYKDIDIGIAVAIKDGLIVPAIKKCNKKTIYEISEERKKLVEKARENKLTEYDLKGARFVISNLGMYEIESFFPIINPYGVAIMGVGKIEKVPIVEGEKIAIKNIMYISFSFDHRVIDGAYAAEFFRQLKEIVEFPCLLLF